MRRKVARLERRVAKTVAKQMIAKVVKTKATTTPPLPRTTSA